MTFYDFFQKASNALYRFFAFPVIRVSLGKCGKHVRVALMEGLQIKQPKAHRPVTGLTTV